MIGMYIQNGGIKNIEIKNGFSYDDRAPPKEPKPESGRSPTMQTFNLY
jgi:hypothetical protein